MNKQAKVGVGAALAVALAAGLFLSNGEDPDLPSEGAPRLRPRLRRRRCPTPATTPTPTTTPTATTTPTPTAMPSAHNHALALAL